MADRLTAIRRRLGDALEAARRQTFWIVLPVATAGVIAVAGMGAYTATLRADAWQARANEIRATGEAVSVWRQELQPAPEAEAEDWARSRRAVEGRGIDPADRIALMQLVAQRADDLGIGNVSVGFVAADTMNIDVFREVDGTIFDPAPYALQLRARVGYGGVASLIGSLPPQVDVHRLTLTLTEDGLEADLVLVVFVTVAA